MSSFKEQLEANAGRIKAVRENIVKKYIDPKVILTERLKFGLSCVDSITLISLSMNGYYTPYSIDKASGTIIYRNQILSTMSCDKNTYDLDFSRDYKNVENGINIVEKTVNVYWLFKLIKEYIKPI
jgi:hypothetical protein